MTETQTITGAFTRGEGKDATFEIGKFAPLAGGSVTASIGNTVVLVEHDPEVIRAADHVIDLGPGAGRLGGRVVAEGTPAQIEARAESVTGRCLREIRGVRPTKTSARVDAPPVVIRGASSRPSS